MNNGGYITKEQSDAIMLALQSRDCVLVWPRRYGKRRAVETWDLLNKYIDSLDTSREDGAD